ncbi:hypothetical protein ACET3Z_023869 [Daucus carota]
MSTHLSICLLLTFIFSFSLALADNTSRKELRSKEVDQDTIIQLARPIPSIKVNPTRAVQLSLRPRVFLYKGFLSDEECDHLISLGHGKKEEFVSDFDNMQNDEMISRIEERISAWTFLPGENSMPLNIMHFGPEDNKQKYDFFGNQSKLLLTENIIATAIFYLSNVSQGGQILLPESDDSQLGNSHVWSDCTRVGTALRPTKGNAVLLFNVHPSASPDRTSSHARCPVLEGEMWCAAKIFHMKVVARSKAELQVELQVDDSDCTDEDESCPKWAEIGECERNPVFMIGSPDYYGTCRKSCNAC